MKTFGKEIDMEKAIHDIAMLFVSKNFDQMMADGKIDTHISAFALDEMFGDYIQAYSYLAQKDEDEIKTLVLD